MERGGSRKTGKFRLGQQLVGNSIVKKLTRRSLHLARSIVLVAIGEYVRSVDVYVTNGGNSPIPLNTRSGWQQKRCNVVVDVCQLDGGTKVKSSAIRTKHNNFLYLQLRVHGNHTFVGDTLQWREIGFVIEIKGHQKQMVKKHFAIDLHSQRVRRSTCTRFCLGAISWRSNFFPDYDQHKCCGDCWSGCSPVAWAQVFGYYDSLGSIPSSPYSGSVYSDIYTMAPKKLDPHKKDPATMKVKSLVEDIHSHTGWFWGRRTKTVCSWKSDHSYQLYLHYGWGGSNNGWQTIDPYGAHVAYLN